MNLDKQHLSPSAVPMAAAMTATHRSVLKTMEDSNAWHATPETIASLSPLVWQPAESSACADTDYPDPLDPKKKTTERRRGHRRQQASVGLGIGIVHASEYNVPDAMSGREVSDSTERAPSRLRRCLSMGPSFTLTHNNLHVHKIVPLPSPSTATTPNDLIPDPLTMVPPVIIDTVPTATATATTTSPSPAADRVIPIICLSPSSPPTQVDKIPLLSELPMLGDFEDNPQSAMVREYKYPSPLPPPYTDNDMVGKCIGEYTIQRLLGIGAFAKVFLATLPNGSTAAIKMINKESINREPRVISSIDREVGILKLIHHPHVVQLHATLETEHHLCIVMEYAPGEELFEFCQKLPRDPVDESLIKSVFLTLVRIVGWMHSHNIVHRDLKLENILIRLDEHAQPHLKLTDFGLARVVDTRKPLTTRCGSEAYAAPEIVLGLEYDGRLTDTWALGIILYALLVGHLPFSYAQARGEKISHMFYRIVCAKVQWPSFPTVSSNAKAVVESLLAREPSERACLETLEQMAWFN